MRWRLRAACSAVLLAASAVALLLVGPRASAQRPVDPLARYAVLISLDGFGADNFDDPRLPIPTLRRLAAEGARAERMTVATPSVTWPNHTTLVTGVMPGRHGVLLNGVVEPRTGQPPLAVNTRRSKDEMCRFPTLYDFAYRAGLRTAEVNWPVTRGAATLEWSLPDYPDALRYSTQSLLAELREAGILTAEDEAGFRGLGPVTRDHIWTQTAVHLIRRHRPNLLLLHLLNTDGTQHGHGPLTREGFTALALADRHVGDVLEALRLAGIAEQTAVFVTADHGFIEVRRQIRPNVRLRREELIRPLDPAAGDDATLEYDAQVVSVGGTALVYVPRGRFRPELLTLTRAALDGLEGVERILEPSEFEALGLPVAARNPQGPDFVLCAAEGYAFHNAVTGEEIEELDRPVGTHGYLHTNPRMDAILVAAGAGIRRGARLPRARSVDVAPTMARILGLPLRDVDGRVLTEFLALPEAP